MLRGILLNDATFIDREDYNELREFIVEHVYETICKNPKSIPLFREGAVREKSELYYFYDYIVNNELNCHWLLVAFYDDLPRRKGEDIAHLGVGVALFYVENPWYSNNETLQEMLTVSFKKHCGLAAAVADWMEDYARKHNIPVIGAACANAPYSEMVANTYKKKGFTVYPTFYKEIK